MIFGYSKIGPRGLISGLGRFRGTLTFFEMKISMIFDYWKNLFNLVENDYDNVVDRIFSGLSRNEILMRRWYFKPH